MYAYDVTIVAQIAGLGGGRRQRDIGKSGEEMSFWKCFSMNELPQIGDELVLFRNLGSMKDPFILRVTGRRWSEDFPKRYKIFGTVLVSEGGRTELFEKSRDWRQCQE